MLHLHISIIVFDASLAEFVQTGADVPGVVIDGSANLAEQSRVLQLVEQIRRNEASVRLVQHARLCYRFEVI